MQALRLIVVYRTRRDEEVLHSLVMSGGNQLISKCLRHPERVPSANSARGYCTMEVVISTNPALGSLTLFRAVFFLALASLLIACGGGEPSQREAPVGRATLTVMSVSPLAVSGRGFKASERVVVSTGAARTSVTANSAGRFVVRFPRLRCAGATIRAIGSKGSRATTRPPKVLCIEP
jgi:hypothetical protein